MCSIPVVVTICDMFPAMVSGLKVVGRSMMIASIQSICPKIEEMLAREAVVRIFGDVVLEITHARWYVRIVLEGRDRVDKPFFVAVYERERLPKTVFYTDPWVPSAASAEDVLKIVRSVFVKGVG